MIKHDDWMKTIEELNKDQPSLLSLVEEQIENYEKEKQQDRNNNGHENSTRRV